jgi:hypothetical protein
MGFDRLNISAVVVITRAAQLTPRMARLDEWAAKSKMTVTSDGMPYSPAINASASTGCRAQNWRMGPGGRGKRRSSAGTGVRSAEDPWLDTLRIPPLKQRRCSCEGNDDPGQSDER